MISKIRLIPVILLLRSSSSREIIEKDINRWVEILGPVLSSLPLVHKLGWLMDLENVEEFRNLFYYRVGVPASLWGQLLLFFSMKLFRPRDSLRINTPSIGPGLLIRHGVGCVLQAKSIGENCLMAHEVVIASKDESDNLPVIGNYVSMSAGCKILGPVTVGDYSIIGANAVVTKDVPPRSIAVGVPARIVSMDRDRKKQGLSEGA